MELTIQEAESVLGQRLDRRRRYFLWGGEVCYNVTFTIPCSGCTSDDYYISESAGTGCSECGYTGKRRDSCPVPVKRRIQ